MDRDAYDRPRDDRPRDDRPRDDRARDGGGDDVLAVQAGAAIVHYRRGAAGLSRDEQQRALVRERPLVIEVVDGDSYTIMRTPGADLDLAVGFLLAEGMIDGLDDIARLAADCELGNTVRVTLVEPPSSSDGGRNLAVASSCGLCGRAGVDKLIASLPPVRGGIELPVDVLFEVPARLRAAQRVFQQTGGSHAAALFDERGELVVVGEDLGRHSALDKALGRAVRQGISMRRLGAMISGRTSLEMIVKVARAGIALLVAVSAPSSAAVECAERLGITLCGFARGDELSVYSNPSALSGR